ncbi:MAG: hypothetical protein FWD54_01530 [Endomicrobia bacterium]|nr:hypothetical protein [Endomicrobiia bacterium]
MFEGFINGVLANIVYDFIKTNRLNSIKDVKSEPVMEIKVPFVEKTNKSYKEELSERLRLSIQLLSCKNDPLMLSKVRDFLNYGLVGEIEKYFDGIKEAPLPFIERYAKFFGLEKAWLIHGEGNKFVTYRGLYLSPRKYFQVIVDTCAKQIFFVRSKDWEVGIVLKLSGWEFIILPLTVNFAIDDEQPDRANIVNFYDTIKYILNDPLTRRCQFKGILMSQKDFLKLFSGELYPKELDSLKYYNDSWWDDFLDIEYIYKTSKNYEQLYGRIFIRNQEIVKDRYAKGYVS